VEKGARQRALPASDSRAQAQTGGSAAKPSSVTHNICPGGEAGNVTVGRRARVAAAPKRCTSHHGARGQRDDALSPGKGRETPETRGTNQPCRQEGARA